MICRNTRRASAALLWLLVLAGCVPMARTPPAPADWQHHVASIAARDAWRLSGKIGLRGAAKNGSAFLNWEQQGNRFRLVMSGALGIGRLVLNGDAEGISWTDQRGGGGQHANPDALVEQMWGWHIPVRALRYWARGIPQPDTRVKQLRIVDGTAESFTQSGWQLRYDRYRSEAGLMLPGRLRMDRDGVALTLVIASWGSSP